MAPLNVQGYVLSDYINGIIPKLKLSRLAVKRQVC